LFDALRVELRERGYVEGQNFKIESRWAEGNYERLRGLAAELVHLKVDVIVTYGTPASRAANPGNAPQVRHAQDAAQTLHIRVQILGAKGPSDIDGAFSAISREHAEGVIVLVDAVLQNNRARITELAARNRLPAVYGLSEYTDVGGLMAYGPDRLDMFRHAAIYVDQILKGAKPGDLPVEQPKKFSLVVNQKTAKALGLTIPQMLLLRADQVIQ
jgi:putative tryptophan/tyrosine transport system substrate-binding protein